MYMYYVMLSSLSSPSIRSSSLSFPPIRSFVCRRRHRHPPLAPCHMLILRPACTTPMLFAFVLLSCILYCLYMYYVMPSSSHSIRSSSLSFPQRSILRPRRLVVVVIPLAPVRSALPLCYLYVCSYVCILYCLYMYMYCVMH